MSERRACRLAGQHRSTQRHEAVVADDDAALRAELRKISRKRPRWGYRRAHQLLLDDGWEINCKRTQRLWREEGLRVPQKRRKRRRLGDSTVPARRLRAERPDHVWAFDFQFDQTADGRLLKLLHARRWRSSANAGSTPTTSSPSLTGSSVSAAPTQRSCVVTTVLR